MTVSPETYAILLKAVSPVMMLMFWTVAAALWMEARRNNQLGRRLGSIGWATHVAIYWTVQVGLRWLSDYSLPSTWVSLWSLIIFIHAGISLLWMAWVLWHYGVPPPLEFPSDWQRREEDGSDDG